MTKHYSDSELAEVYLGSEATDVAIVNRYVEFPDKLVELLNSVHDGEWGEDEDAEDIATRIIDVAVKALANRIQDEYEEASDLDEIIEWIKEGSWGMDPEPTFETILANWVDADEPAQEEAQRLLDEEAAEEADMAKMQLAEDRRSAMEEQEF
jgi:hypothetical protein